jgi:cyclic pyranopterin phosphate synthase
MPPEGILLKPHSDILRYEEIIKIVTSAAELGISKIRLTGGEPLIKKNIEFLIAEIAKTPGISETCMTTNGSLLTKDKAFALKKSGLTRVNISLDTLDSEKFSRLTRGGSLEQILQGIEAAIAAELTPIKLNMILFDDTTSVEVEAMRTFCKKKGLCLQTIRHFTLSTIKTDMIRADRPSPCSECNRLRLTCDGYLKPCLFSNLEYKVDMKNIRQSVLDAVNHKPKAGHKCDNRVMVQIGG